MVSDKTDTRSPLRPSVYKADYGDIPNLILEGPRQLNVGGQGVVPHVIGVEAPTHLHDLWSRIKPFQKPNETIRVIWAACSVMGNESPLADGA